MSSLICIRPHVSATLETFNRLSELQRRTRCELNAVPMVPKRYELIVEFTDCITLLIINITVNIISMRLYQNQYYSDFQGNSTIQLSSIE